MKMTQQQRKLRISMFFQGKEFFFLPPRLEILINLINHGIINFNCGFKLSCQKVGQKMTRIPPPAFSITGNKSQLRRTDIRSVLSLLLATSHK
jgi:hypothetical protein